MLESAAHSTCSLHTRMSKTEPSSLNAITAEHRRPHMHTRTQQARLTLCLEMAATVEMEPPAQGRITPETTPFVTMLSAEEESV